MKVLFGIVLSCIYTIVFFSMCFSQPENTVKDQYQIGPDERLLITVHIWGEVKSPGEYIVPDNTDILELISKAGGPTEYSNLSSLKITRGLLRSAEAGTPNTMRSATGSDEKTNSSIKGKQIIELNLKKLIENKEYYQQLPILRPGDVISVGRNTWYRWQTVIRVVSQLAIVAQVWFWYSRI